MTAVTRSVRFAKWWWHIPWVTPPSAAAFRVVKGVVPSPPSSVRAAATSRARVCSPFVDTRGLRTRVTPSGAVTAPTPTRPPRSHR